MNALRLLLLLFLVLGCSPGKQEEKQLSSEQKEELAQLLVVCTEIFNNWLELMPLLTTDERMALQKEVNSYAGKEKLKSDFQSETLRATQFNTELLNKLAARQNPGTAPDFFASAERLKAAMTRITEHIQQGLLPERAFSLAYSNRLFSLISRAATNGIADAQLSMAEHYEKGGFVIQDQSLSQFWLSEAARNGSKEAAEKLKPKAEPVPEKLTNLRLVGTNLYDFSFVVLTQNSPFRISGQIVDVLPASVKVSRNRGERLAFSPAIDAKYATPGEQLELLAALQLSHDTNGNPKEIPLGQLMSLSPSMRRHFSSQPWIEEVYLLNAPGQRSVGLFMDEFAIPVGKSRDGRFHIWDCGRSYTNDLNLSIEPRQVYDVRPTGIVRRTVKKGSQK